MMFADLIGASEQSAELTYAHAGFREGGEAVFARPFGVEQRDYVQGLTDMAQQLGSALGWSPTT